MTRPRRPDASGTLVRLVLAALLSLAVTSSVPAATGPLDRLGSSTLEGSHVTQRLTAPTTGTEMAVALVIEEGAADASHHLSRVLLFSGPPGSQKLLREEEYPWARLDRIEDVDRDGWPELVFTAFDGGTCWSCSYVQLWRVRKDRVDSTLPAEKVQRLEDIDHDGIVEGVGLETRWEGWGGLCHACSPRIERIYRSGPTGWVDTSAAFPAFYRQSLAQLQERLAAEVKDPGGRWDDMRLGLAISILLHRIQLGEAQQGWQELDDQIDRWRDAMAPDAIEPRTHLDETLRALKSELQRP